MNKDRILEKKKTNDFVKFCVIQLVLVLLYQLLKYGSQYYHNLKFIHLIFLIINESWLCYIFCKKFSRKSLIDNQGHIKEVNHNKTQIIFIFKIFLIVLIYMFFNVIVISFAKLMLSNPTYIQDITTLINLILIIHIFLESFRVIISEQFGVYVPMGTIILIAGVLASVSNDILATFLISTLFFGVINWLVSEDGFRYLQEIINISTDLTINIDTKSKKILSNVKARTFFCSIAYNLSILTSKYILQFAGVRKNLSDLAIFLKLSSKNNQVSQDFFCNLIVKVGLLVLYYLILKIFIDTMLRKREYYGIPIVSGILNIYNDLIFKEFKNIIDNNSLNEIRIKNYYIKKINKYFNIRENSKIYVKFDNQNIFDHYISSKTYKSLDIFEKRKYYKTKKSKINKQIEILNESLESKL
ncbi:hypothetical protein KZA79_008185 [Streptococcus mitis]|uniref:hypothetical protein n=1 Tax=Streptococcus mitis TaxID=28037 RepID=UPI001C56AE75|nr:hypothetical protein [Streptococcus mitis]MBW3454830.1 hypothetical protein [Streptococcus mitis]